MSLLESRFTSRGFRAQVLAVTFAFALVASAAGQTIWYVDAASPCPGSGTEGDPFCTIQAAIDAAAANATPPDEIHVADGIYTGTGNKDLDFGGKKIKLIGVNGAANCIIDCQNSGRGFYFHSGETAASVVDGFTIQNGLVNDASPGQCKGGAVFCSAGSGMTLSSCVIANNTASGQNSAPAGGGVYCAGPTTTITHCTITGNLATSPAGFEEVAEGGGVYCADSTVLINCAILNNEAYAEATIATPLGGGIFWGSARACGGGVYGASSLINCLITDNECGARLTYAANQGESIAKGGGVYSTASSGTTFLNCTTARNVAWADAPFSPTYGGNGLGTLHPSTVANCILWDDWMGLGSELTGSFTVTYSDVLYGYAGTGNIGTDPGFVYAGGDLQLTPGSPCIDTGDPAFVPQPGETDLDGHRRVWDGNDDGTARVDMGAYEYGSFSNGDTDCSGGESGLDIQAFVMAMLDPGGYAAAYPNCNALVADMNGDGVVDLADVALFVNLVLTSS